MSPYPALAPPLPSRLPTTSRPGDQLELEDGDDARLSVTLSWSQEQCVVTLVGNLDRSTAVAVAAQFDQLIRANFDEVVLDLTGIRDVEYFGAVALVEIWARLWVHNMRCRVRGLATGFDDDPLHFLQFVRTLGQQPSGWRTATGTA